MKIKAKIGTAIAIAALMALPVQMAFAAEASPTIESTSVQDDGVIVVRSNTGDTWYNFPFSESGSTWATSGRAKEDSSSAYIQVVTMTMDYCKVYIDGGRTIDGPWSNQVSYWSGSATGNSCSVTSTGQFGIMNKVNENGLGYARLTGWACSQPGELSGYWSPDSWGTYPKIND